MFYALSTGSFKVKHIQLSCYADGDSGDITSPFFTLTLVGGERSASRPGHFNHGERTGWAPEPVMTLWSREKSLPLPGIESRSSSP
jgi:hypothetical protein